MQAILALGLMLKRELSASHAKDAAPERTEPSPHPRPRNGCGTLTQCVTMPTSPDEAAPLVRRSSCVTRAIAGETLIIPIVRATADLESIFTLNAVGSRIWELLERPVAPSQLVATIAREFDVSPDDAARDVAEFLDSLRAAGLIAPLAG